MDVQRRNERRLRHADDHLEAGWRQAHRPLLGPARRGRSHRHNQRPGVHVQVHRGRAGQQPRVHVSGHGGEQGLAQRESRHRRSRERHIHGEEAMTNRDSGFGIRDSLSHAATLLLACAVAYVASGFSRTVAAQAPDPEALYKSNCASCHDNPEGRTPPRAALRDRTPEAILTAMTSGSMSVQAVNISPADKRRLAELLAGKPFSVASLLPIAGLCTTKPSPIGSLASKPYWNGWGVDATNARYQPRPGITAADVPNLKLKWAFGFPGGTQAYGNPVIVAGRVFVGSDNGTLYSLDANTGCAYWTFKAAAGVRAAPSIGREGRKDAGDVGDLQANLYALDAVTGEVIWKKQVDPHAFARVTGAPTLHGGRLYVPVASVEEVPAAQLTYECCTFRGSVVALDAATGNQIWKSYTISETPVQTGQNSKGTPQWAPAGAAVWSSPTIDEKRGAGEGGAGRA